MFGASVSILVSHIEWRRYIAGLIFCPTPNSKCTCLNEHSLCCGCQLVSKDLDSLHDEYIRLRERILKQLDGIPADSEQAKYLRSQLDYIKLRIRDLQGLNNSYFNR